MRTSLAFLLAAALTIGLAAAVEVEAGLVDIGGFAIIDGELFELPAVQDGKFVRIGSPSLPVLIGDPTVGQMRISAKGNMDPAITYAISVTDPGDPSAFVFLFAIPIVPVGTPNLVKASIAGLLRDATGDGVSLSPMLGDKDGDGTDELQASFVSPPDTIMGVDVGAAFSGLAGPYGPFTAGPQPGPGPGPWTALSIGVAFDLSGGGDRAEFSGSVSVAAVPAPATLLALGCGVVGLGLAVRRRRVPNP